MTTGKPEHQQTIYLVDDDPSVRASLVRFLTFRGFAVSAFASAKEFLAAPRPDQPACLVLDLQMPGMGGLALQSALAELDGALPIIFITAYGTVAEGVRAMKAGALDFLEKPFDNDQLLLAIGRALERGRADQAAHAKRRRIEECYQTLTVREREVLALVVQGFTNPEIAEQLGNTVATVKIHRGRVMDKMGAPTLAKLIKLAAIVQP